MMEPYEESDDINLEPDAEMGEVGAAKEKLRKLRIELQEAHSQKQEYLEGWQRAKADLINAKREAGASADKKAHLLRDSLVEDIIPALDSFDMAAQSDAWETIDKGWRTGMENVQSQLLDALERHGVRRFGRIGETFDPNLHEAVQEEHEGLHAEGDIVRVLRYGYRTENRLVRPAQVIVFKELHHPDES